MRKISVSLFVFALAACGGTRPIPMGPSCDGTASGIHVCADFIGVTASQVPQLQAACSSQLNGTYSNGACNRAGVVGGCEGSSGNVTQVTWIYTDSGATTSQVMQACQQQNESYVSP